MKLLEKELDRVKTLKKGVDTLLRSMKKFSSFHDRGIEYLPQIEMYLKGIERGVREIKGFDLAPSEMLLNSLKVWFKEKEKEARFNFRAELSELLKEKGLSLEGQFPELRVRFYRILLDFEKKKGTISFGPEAEKWGIPLFVKDISDALFNVMKRIEGREIDVHLFLKQLFLAYMRILQSTGREVGSPAPLAQIMVEMAFLGQKGSFRKNPVAKNYSDYSRSMFGYDLYRLNRSGVKVVENMRLFLTVATFAATKDRSDFIWVPDSENGDGTSYMSLTFKKDDTNLGLFDRGDRF